MEADKGETAQTRHQPIIDGELNSGLNSETIFRVFSQSIFLQDEYLTKEPSPYLDSQIVPGADKAAYEFSKNAQDQVSYTENWIENIKTSQFIRSSNPMHFYETREERELVKILGSLSGNRKINHFIQSSIDVLSESSTKYPLESLKLMGIIAKKFKRRKLFRSGGAKFLPILENVHGHLFIILIRLVNVKALIFS